MTSIVNLTEDDFERGYGRFCLFVVQGLSEYLRLNHGATYDEAAQSLGYHHSDFRPAELLSELPYYGQVLQSSTVEQPKSSVPDEKTYGKIANPTVHAALNQLRKVVNAIIKLHGSIDEVVIEVARALPLGKKGLDELNKEI